MSQVDSFYDDKTCLSRMYHISISDQYMSTNLIHTKSVVLIVTILSLNSTFG